MTIKLIVGLGNPGRKYEHTRHNAGFRVLDALAKKYRGNFFEEKKIESLASAFDRGQKRVILCKPQTFMNESGRAVKKLLTTYHLPLTSLLVIHDEIDLPLGSLRLGRDSGAAGHNGVASMIEKIGRDFSRLRLGIENRQEFRVPRTEDYVLQKFSAAEEEILQKKIIPAALAEIDKFLD